MNVINATLFGYKFLNKSKIAFAEIDSEVLLGYVLKKPLPFLYLNQQAELSKRQKRKYLNLLNRRTKHEPVAYILGTKCFYQSEFLVNKSVLIPRPETELLIDEILKITDLKTKRYAIADLGTGCGNIAVSLAKVLPKSLILATDNSAKALILARKNATKYKLNNNVKFFQGSFLKPLLNHRLDILAANLPYLNNKEMTKVIKTDLSYEPRIALSGGADGLAYYRKLVAEIAQRDQKPKYIFFEIGSEQYIRLSKYISRLLPMYFIEAIKDYASIDRVVKLTKKGR
ncbi:MAG: peptide chain release factor N(5)-glutamine methyltransferase [Patescibacteria group bacterium]|nr:peptide chain release factor N(5)-glutamine methyltransferase [Patescibacteria group bacterium]